jgi:hypothetical protein
VPLAIPRWWRAMTDLVAFPKPRFTSRVMAFNRAVDCECHGRIRDAADQVISRWRRMVQITAITDEKILRLRYRASARRFVINKPAYNWLYPDSVMRTALRAFAPYRRTMESVVPLR